MWSFLEKILWVIWFKLWKSEIKFYDKRLLVAKKDFNRFETPYISRNENKMMDYINTIYNSILRNNQNEEKEKTKKKQNKKIKKKHKKKIKKKQKMKKKEKRNMKREYHI